MGKLKPDGITLAHLQRANIGNDYYECDFANYIGPASTRDASISYLKNLKTMKEDGLGILFGGPPGPGKTTASVIILKYLARAGWSVWMTSLSQIIEEIQKGWEEKETTGFLETCREVDFLLIDDLGREHAGPTGFSATVFDNLIRHRVQHRLPTLFTTNLDRAAIKKRYGDGLLSLIEGKCKIEVVDGADVRRTVQKKEIESKF